MGPLLRLLWWVVFTGFLAGASACSEKGSSEGIGQPTGNAADVGRESPDQRPYTARQRLAARAKDVVISAKVKARLLRERVLKTSDIDVTTRNRVVVLTGTVEKPEDARRAIQIAQSVNEVESVDNQLAVRSGG
jgi:hyperosmotically inducible periplasmic protein